MILRIVLGLILIVIYGLVFTGAVDWFAGFNQAQKLIFSGKSIALVKAGTGIIFIYLIAISSIYGILFTKERYKLFIGICLAGLLFLTLLAFE